MASNKIISVLAIHLDFARLAAMGCYDKYLRYLSYSKLSSIIYDNANCLRSVKLTMKSITTNILKAAGSCDPNRA